MWRRIAVWAAVLGVLAGLAGCGRKSREQAAERAIERAIEKQTGSDAQVSIGDETVTIKSKEGQFSMAAGESAKVPAGFPADVPVYKGAKLELAAQNDKGFTLSLRTADAAAKAAQTYKSEMLAQGWTEEMSLNTGEQTVLAYRKDKRVVNLVVGPDGSDTQIMVTVGTE